MKTARLSRTKVARRQAPAASRNRARIGLVLGITLALYPLMWLAVSEVGPVGAALVTIPVALAGWYFGVLGGVAAGILGILLVISMLVWSRGNDWLYWLWISWPGTMMLILVGVLAGRVQKAFMDRTQAVDELRSRERYLTLLNMATRDILSRRKLEDAYYHLTTHLLNLFVADYAYLVRWDAVHGRPALVASTAALEADPTGTAIGPAESALVSRVLRDGVPLGVDEGRPLDPGGGSAGLAGFALPTQAVLAIPIIAKGYRFGAAIIAYSRPHRLSEDEIQSAELAGYQIALALFATEQERQIQHQLKETDALARIERALSETERVGIETVLQLIVDSARDLIPGAEQAVLHLLDEERQILVPRAIAGGYHRITNRLNMRLGEGVAGQVIAGGEVIRVDDAGSDARFLNQSRPAGFRSLIVAPVESNQRRVGTISIQSPRPEAFTADHGRLLAALGTQAAIAIENAHMLETTRQDLKEINALYRISQGLAASLDPTKLMRETVDRLQQDFGYYHVHIFLVEAPSGDLLAQEGSGKIGRQLRRRKFRLPAGAGIVGHAAEIGEPFFTNDVEAIVFFVRNPLLPNTQSELAVPIRLGRRVLGVLDVQQAPPARLTKRDLSLLEAVSDQLAVALQKARLYSDLQTSLRKEKATRAQLIQSERLAMVGRLLASVSHELNNPLQAIQNALFLLQEEKGLSTQARQDLEVVLGETERMAALIDRLRGTYRPTRDEDLQDIRLNDLIQDVAFLIGTHLRHSGVRFEFWPDPNLPAVRGVADQIRQVVLNLMMNAIEAMPDGGLLVVSTQAEPANGRVILTLTDSGAGIDGELLPHIFEPFVTGKDSGTGLGLTISYDIIRQHGGDIQAENNSQAGATFRVWLPAIKKGSR
jgi:signal transduction histidine kinase